MKNFSAILNKNIRDLMSSYDAVKDLDHEGLKGSARESYLMEFLEKYVPPHFGLTMGKIEDNFGNSSGEIDLLIYDKRLVNASQISSTISVVPIESVRYVFEIKSTLRSNEVKSTIKKFERLKKLHSETDKYPTRVLFAFSSDLKSKSELERVKNNDINFNLKPAIQVLVVIGKGYWFRGTRHYNVVEKNYTIVKSVYHKLNSSEDKVELKSFLAAVLTSLDKKLGSFFKYIEVEKGVKAKFEQEYETEIRRIENSFENESKSDSKINITQSYGLINNTNENLTIDSDIVVPFIDSNSDGFPDLEPIISINITNNNKAPIILSKITVLTSKGLRFYRPLEGTETHLPYILHPDKNVTIDTRLITFPKSEKTDSIGGHLRHSIEDIIGSHQYKFKRMSLNGVLSVIELELLESTIYSDEFLLTQFTESKEMSNFDFLLHYNGLTKLLTGKLRYEKGLDPPIY